MPTPDQWGEVLGFFGSACAYCGLAQAAVPILKDHRVALGRQSGGLHAWGNVVPSCRPCNNSKPNEGCVTGRQAAVR